MQHSLLNSQNQRQSKNAVLSFWANLHTRIYISIALTWGDDFCTYLTTTDSLSYSWGSTLGIQRLNTISINPSTVDYVSDDNSWTNNRRFNGTRKIPVVQGSSKSKKLLSLSVTVKKIVIGERDGIFKEWIDSSKVRGREWKTEWENESK